jgi:predicted  nucleic acid-binding Zn-ribbon protein
VTKLTPLYGRTNDAETAISFRTLVNNSGLVDLDGEGHSSLQDEVADLQDEVVNLQDEVADLRPLISASQVRIQELEDKVGRPIGRSW